MNVSLKQACAILRVGETVINERVENGTLPAKVPLLGTRRMGFDIIELENAIRRDRGQEPMLAQEAVIFTATAMAVTAFLAAHESGAEAPPRGALAPPRQPRAPRANHHVVQQNEWFGQVTRHTSHT